MTIEQIDAEAYEVEAGDRGQPVDPPDLQTAWADVVARNWDRRPLVPASLRSAEARAAQVRWSTSVGAYLALYHSTRLPKYAAKVAWWAPIGVGRTVGKRIRWASAEDGNWSLRQQAAN